MNKSRQVASAHLIAEIRRLQLERTRLEVQLSTRTLDDARRLEQQALSGLNAGLDEWRMVLHAATSLSPLLALNASGAVASAHAAHQRALQETGRATTHVNEKRRDMLFAEQRMGQAEERLQQARRRFKRALEEREASQLEERYSYGDRP